MKIFSQNVFVRPKPIRTGSHDYRKSRLRILAPRLQEYDVVCLQEFFVSRSNRDLIESFVDEMELNGFEFRMTGPTEMCCHPVEGGLAMFSKTQPIESGQTTFACHGHSSDWFACKGFEWAVFEDFLLVNTHLQADYSKESADAQWTTELIQLREIATFIAEGKHENVILLGDLNIDGITGRFIRQNDKFSKEDRLACALDLVSNQFVPEEPRENHAEMPSLGKATSSGYTEMLSVLPGFRDLCLEQYGLPPVTFRDCDVVNDVIIEQDRFLNPHSDLCSCRRLDYCFFKGSAECSARINVMRITQNEHEFLQKLSDHSAIEVVFCADVRSEEQSEHDAVSTKIQTQVEGNEHEKPTETGEDCNSNKPNERADLDAQQGDEEIPELVVATQNQ